MRVTVIWMGRTKSPAAAQWTDDHLKRLRGFSRWATVDGEELSGRDPQQALLKRARGARLWLLDPAGRQFTSPDFAAFLDRQARVPGELLIAVGGADGFRPDVEAVAAGRLSLSLLTFSHELARVALLEQLYRALAIWSHHPYPH